MPGAAFENLPKTSLHCCIFANCTGSFPPVNTGAVTDDGALVNWTLTIDRLKVEVEIKPGMILTVEPIIPQASEAPTGHA